MRNLLPSLIANTEQGLADRHVCLRRYGPGRLVLEGYGRPGLFYMQHGRMELLITTADGNERCMRILAESDLFGLECLHAGASVPGYQVRAVTYSSVVHVDVELLDLWLATVPEFRHRLAARIATDIARLEQEREKTVAFSVAERLVCYLRCGESCAHLSSAPPEPAGPLPMAILARRIGCSPAYLSRAVRKLAQQGVVQRVNHLPRIDRMENFSPCPCSVVPEGGELRHGLRRSA